MAQLFIYANKEEKTSFQDNLSTFFKKTDHDSIVQKTCSFTGKNIYIYLPKEQLLYPHRNPLAISQTS